MNKSDIKTKDHFKTFYSYYLDKILKESNSSEDEYKKLYLKYKYSQKNGGK